MEPKLFPDQSKRTMPQRSESIRGVQEERYSMVEVARLFQAYSSTFPLLTAEQRSGSYP